MPGNFKTEAVVLRSIRYGEADRIVHLYSATRGRIGAIAKGSRRPKSRFGGRLEPFFRLDLVLYEGRGDLFTVTGASTVDGHGTLRSNGPALGSAGAGLRRGAAAARLGRAERGRLQPALQLPGACSTPIPSRPAPRVPRWPSASSWRWRPGSHRSWRAARSCGEAEHLAAFSGSAGGVVCASCEGGGFPFSEEAHRFMVEALARPLSQAPEAEQRVAAQADRAITETLEHHAHVHLRAAA